MVIRNKTFFYYKHSTMWNRAQWSKDCFVSTNSEVKAFNGYIGLPDTDLPYRTQGSWCWQDKNDQGKAHSDQANRN